MQVSLRVPPETGTRLASMAQKTGKTKTALILEALDEKYRSNQNRAQLIRDLSGWMSKSECDALRIAVGEFASVDEADWR